MSSLHVPVALTNLRTWMQSRNYAIRCIHETLNHVHQHGEISGAVDAGYLDAADLEQAEAAYVEGFPPLVQQHPDWDDPDAWTLGPAIPADATLLPPDLVPDDAFDPAPSDLAWVAGLADLPPIVGGAPEPSVPTADDWRDYHESGCDDHARDTITDQDLAAAGLPVG